MVPRRHGALLPFPDSMPWLRGNLHAHTTFSDGVKDPAQLIAAYETLGYDFLAITDHENWIDERYWLALPKLSSNISARSSATARRCTS